MRDRYYPGPGDEADCWLDTDNAVRHRWRDDRAICLTSYRDRNQIRRDRNARARTGTAGILVEEVRHIRLPTAARPSAGLPVPCTCRTEICPFAQVCLAEDDCTGLPELCGDMCVLLWCRSVEKRPRAGRGVHLVRGVDVVLYQDGNSVHHRADLSFF